MHTPKKISAGAFFLCLPIMLIGLLFAGCKLMGQNPSAPSKFEESLFTVQTNHAPKIVLQTNVIEVTKEVVLFKTNEVGQIVNYTNIYTVPKFDLITVTQQVETYTLAPRESSREAATMIGGVVNTFAPGIGTVVSGVLLGLLGGWAKVRSVKRTGGVLAQNIEAIREFVKTLPDGEKYDGVIVQYLEKHQHEAGAADSVLKLLENYVDNTQAKGAATELKNALASLK